MKALFITLKELKRKSIFDGNIDADKLIQFVEVAQDTNIQQYLGTALYNRLQADIIANTLSGNYLTLVNDYIKPMLIWYTQSTILPYIMFSITNGGVGKHISENSETATHDDMTYLGHRMNDTAEFYTKRFLDYMCSYSNLYQEYTSSSNEDMHPDRDVNYTGGWYI